VAREDRKTGIKRMPLSRSGASRQTAYGFISLPKPVDLAGFSLFYELVTTYFAFQYIFPQM
jgi:hypothetical protein